MDINEFLLQFGLKKAIESEDVPHDVDFHYGIECYCRGLSRSSLRGSQKDGWEAASAASRVIIRYRALSLSKFDQTKLEL